MPHCLSAGKERAFDIDLLFSHPFMSIFFRPHVLQHIRPHCSHHLLTFAQVHARWISDAIQLSHPLMPSSSSAFNLYHDQGIFQ